MSTRGLPKNSRGEKTRRRSRHGVTIQEVARRARVSPMTVSRVVNGHKYVSEDTREAVFAAIRELKYAPNLAARSLAGAQGVRIGLLYGNPSAAYLSEFLLGALEESSRKGAQLVLERCEPSGPESKRAVRRLLGTGVSGVVLPPPLCESSLIRAELKAAGIPFVAVATGQPAPDVMSVRIDDFAAAAEMTRYLLSLGHRRLGFIKGHPNQTASEERYRGFQAALREANANLPEPRVEQGFFTYRSGLEAAAKLLEGRSRPTAIFASNDDMAAGVVAEAHRRGINVPKDLTVVGFDDTLIASTMWPALTTVHQPIAEMAEAAVELLVKEIQSDSEGGASKPKQMQKLISHALVTRESASRPSQDG